MKDSWKQTYQRHPQTAAGNQTESNGSEDMYTIHNQVMSTINLF